MKHGSGMVMLVIMLGRKPLKDWKQGNTTNKKYLEAKKKAERAVCQTKYKHELKDFITLCRGMIRNVMCLRYQRRW